MSVSYRVPFLADWSRDFAGRRVPVAAVRARIAAAVILLDRLKWAYELDDDAHELPDGMFHGFDDESLRRSLRPFVWTVDVLRTRKADSHFVPPAIGALLRCLRRTDLKYQPESRRGHSLEDAQRFLLDHARARLCRCPIRVESYLTQSTEFFIRKLLQKAAGQGKLDQVACGLVGTYLHLRFPGIRDDDVSRFFSDDATFYVVTRPLCGHFESMRQDVLVGLSPHLLVPSGRLAGAKDHAEDTAPGRIVVHSVEGFVSAGIDAKRLPISVRQTMLSALIDAYNDRITHGGEDRSLRIEIPRVRP